MDFDGRDKGAEIVLANVIDITKIVIVNNIRFIAPIDHNSVVIKMAGYLSV